MGGDCLIYADFRQALLLLNTPSHLGTSICVHHVKLDTFHEKKKVTSRYAGSAEST